MIFALWRRFLFKGVDDFEFGYIVLFSLIMVLLIYAGDFIYKKLKQRNNK